MGFAYGHIWACPPSKGDDYVFYGHPEDQKTPKPKRLQEWYKSMCDEAKLKNYIAEWNDLVVYREKDEINSTIQIPRFSGDYWPDLIEQQIAKLMEDADGKEEGNTTSATGKAGSKAAKSNKKASGKKKLNKKNNKVINRKHSELASALFDMMAKNKDVFFVLQLAKDPSNT
ncbi:H3 K56 histone acetylation protein RTT109, partial [Sphaeroforma arctica JP610]